MRESSRDFLLIKPPRVWTVFLTYALSFILAGLISQTVLITTVAWRSGSASGSVTDMTEVNFQGASESESEVILRVGCEETVLGCAAVGLAFMSPASWRKRLRLVRPRISPLRQLVFSAGCPAIGFVFLSLAALNVGYQTQTFQEDDKFHSRLTGGAIVIAVIVFGLLAGTAEELLFRGFIQTRLSDRWGPNKGVLWSSVLFGVTHFSDLPNVASAIGVGIYLGYVTERANSVLPAIIGHVTNNAAMVLCTLDRMSSLGPRLNLLILCISILTLRFSIHYLRPAAAGGMPSALRGHAEGESSNGSSRK